MLGSIKKTISILTKKERIWLFFIFIVMLISAALDLIGVSAIMPFITVLNYNGQIVIDGNTSEIIKFAVKLFNTTDANTIALALLVGLIIFYLLKTAYMFFSTYVLNKFTMSLSRNLARKQMNTCLSMPYEYHLNNNSSTLIRKCTYDISAFTNAVGSALTFFVKLLTAISIVVYLIFTDPLVTLIIGGALVLFSIFILLIIKPHIRRVSKRNQDLNSQNYKYLSQAFNGIKESKISNTESYFSEQYIQNIKHINNMNLRYVMYQAIPGHTLEMVGMVGLCVALIAAILTKNPNSDNSVIIAKFSVFAYAVIKLLPCIDNINAFFNHISYYKVSIESIYADIEDAKLLQLQIDNIDDSCDPIPFNKEILLKNVSFSYSSNKEKNILDCVSCVIHKNTSVAFSGVSGAGKTTIIDNILGLLEPTSGSITCDGLDIFSNLKGWRKNISYIPQTIYLMDDTIRKNIAFGLSNNQIDDNKIWDALRSAQLDEFVKSLPQGLETVIGERGVRLSGGQRQRIGIARAFYRNTNIIVFDEATSALDFETEKNILDHVSCFAKNHTLIIITHRLNTIESCDSIFKISDGKLIKIK